MQQTNPKSEDLCSDITNTTPISSIKDKEACLWKGQALVSYSDAQ